MVSRAAILIAIVAVVASLVPSANAFVAPHSVSTSRSSTTAAFVFGKKKEEEDLSFIESRDMTREEMAELNAQNEDIMNMELAAMTGFSLVISLPVLYLCWVAFFSD